MENDKRPKMLAAMLAILFVTYNFVLFMISGFADHTAVFWISWAFTLVAFGIMAVSGSILSQKGMLLKDWLFGYPIIKHCTLYIILELISAVIFFIFEHKVKWQIAFTVQLVLLAIHLVFVISGFLSKQTINEVNTNVADKTRFIKLLRSDAEMLVVKCTDSGVKAKCQKLAETIRFSDPMSSEALFELEKEIASVVNACGNAISANNFDEADSLCGKAMTLLEERNRKCKALK